MIGPKWRIALAIGVLVIFVLVVRSLTPILTPFVVGAALAYLGDPIVDRLELWRLSRTAGVCIVFALFGGLSLLGVIILLPMLYEQLVNTLRRLPDLMQWVQQGLLPRLGVDVPEALKLDPASIGRMVQENWQEAGGLAAIVLGKITQSGGVLLAVVTNLFMIPVVTFYLLRDWDKLVADIRLMLPRKYEERVAELARETDEVLGSFITGQMLVMFSLGTIYCIGLWLIGLDLALLVGLLAGAVSFIPYLGPIVGILAAGIAILVQTQELLPLVWVALVFGIGQVLESVWLTPWLVGDKIGLHPVAVIFAVLAGGQLFGFIGVLIALPAAAVIAVFVRHGRRMWLESDWYAPS